MGAFMALAVALGSFMPFMALIAFLDFIGGVFIDFTGQHLHHCYLCPCSRCHPT